MKNQIFFFSNTHASLFLTGRIIKEEKFTFMWTKLCKFLETKFAWTSILKQSDFTKILKSNVIKWIDITNDQKNKNLRKIVV